MLPVQLLKLLLLFCCFYFCFFFLDCNSSQQLLCNPMNVECRYNLHFGIGWLLVVFFWLIFRFIQDVSSFFFFMELNQRINFHFHPVDNEMMCVNIHNLFWVHSLNVSNNTITDSFRREWRRTKWREAKKRAGDQRTIDK